MVQPIPDDVNQITPYFTQDDPDALIEFITVVFDAEMDKETRFPDGTLMHACYKIGRGSVMIGQSNPQWQANKTNIYIYVEDCDATFAKAIEFGATELMKPVDMWHGDRYGGVADSQGNSWWIVTHIEDVDCDEMARREKEALEEYGKNME